MRERFYRFMQGRYGMDQFSRFLLVIGLVVILMSGFIGGLILNLIGWLIIIYNYFRIFSRNHPKRYRENAKYLYFIDKVRNFLRQKGFLRKNGFQRKDKKTHHVYTCPSCRQKIRIPRGKGRIEVSCPSCRHKFIKMS